jgi:hypothetical protein
MTTRLQFCAIERAAKAMTKIKAAPAAALILGSLLLLTRP